jgi:hypothetical protein
MKCSNLQTAGSLGLPSGIPFDLDDLKGQYEAARVGLIESNSETNQNNETEAATAAGQYVGVDDFSQGYLRRSVLNARHLSEWHTQDKEPLYSDAVNKNHLVASTLRTLSLNHHRDHCTPFQHLNNVFATTAVSHISVPPQVWRPKPASQYVPLYYSNEFTDDLFVFPRYGKAIKHSDPIGNDLPPRDDVCLWNAATDQAEFDRVINIPKKEPITI